MLVLLLMPTINKEKNNPQQTRKTLSLALALAMVLALALALTLALALALTLALTLEPEHDMPFLIHTIILI